MSRNNVFKLSGNMALGGGNDYPSNDFENIKNSLKLLKSKQGGKRNDAPLEPTVPHSPPRTTTVAHTPQTLRSGPPSRPKVPHPQIDFAHYDQPSNLPSRNSHQQHSYKDMAY